MMTDTTALTEKMIRKAAVDCINQDILKDFMLTHKKEMTDMLVTEWDFELEKKVLRREAWEDGMEDGMEIGAKKRALEIAKKMRDRGDDVNTIIEITGLTVDEILPL